MSSLYTGGQERCSIANLRPGYIFISTGDRSVVTASTNNDKGGSNDNSSSRKKKKKEVSQKNTEPKQQPILLNTNDFKEFVKYKVFRYLKYYCRFTDACSDGNLFKMFCAEFEIYLTKYRIADKYRYFRDCCGDIQRHLRVKRSNVLGQFAKKFKRKGTLHGFLLSA